LKLRLGLELPSRQRLALSSSQPPKAVAAPQKEPAKEVSSTERPHRARRSVARGSRRLAAQKSALQHKVPRDTASLPLPSLASKSAPTRLPTAAPATAKAIPTARRAHSSSNMATSAGASMSAPVSSS
jgi:hypothetical protein